MYLNLPAGGKIYPSNRIVTEKTSTRCRTAGKNRTRSPLLIPYLNRIFAALFERSGGQENYILLFTVFRLNHYTLVPVSFSRASMISEPELKYSGTPISAGSPVTSHGIPGSGQPVHFCFFLVSFDVKWWRRFHTVD